MCPAAKTRPGTLDPSISLDLGEFINSDWRDHYINNGRLFIPGYRGPGFTPGDLRAQFWHVQQIAMYRHDAERAAAEVERARAAEDSAEARAEYYRRQLILESRMGMMLATVTHP